MNTNITSVSIVNSPQSLLSTQNFYRKNFISSFFRKSMNASLIPKSYFLTGGVGFSDNKLASFEFALRDAKIERFNLVPVSSICPPDCRRVDIKEGVSTLHTGEIVFCVMCKKTVNMMNSAVTASVVKIKSSQIEYGYFVEHCTENSLIQGMQKCSEIALELVNTLHNIPKTYSNYSLDLKDDEIDPIDAQNRRIAKLDITKSFDNLDIELFGTRGINDTEKKWMTVLTAAIFNLK